MALTEQGAEAISEAQTVRWEVYRKSTTHCPHGHPWADNERWHSRGTRYCRSCNIKACRDRRAARR